MWPPSVMTGALATKSETTVLIHCSNILYHNILISIRARHLFFLYGQKKYLLCRPLKWGHELLVVCAPYFESHFSEYSHHQTNGYQNCFEQGYAVEYRWAMLPYSKRVDGLRLGWSRWFFPVGFFFFFCRLIITSGLLVSCVHPAGVTFLWIKYNLSALLYVASWRRAEIKCSAVAEWQGTLVLHPQSQSEWGRLCPRPVCPFTSMHVCVSMCECMSLCDPPCMHTLLCK